MPKKNQNKHAKTAEALENQLNATTKGITESIEHFKKQFVIGVGAVISVAIHFMNLYAGPHILREDNVHRNLVKVFGGSLLEKHHLVVVRMQQLVSTSGSKEIGDSWWVTITLLLRAFNFKLVSGEAHMIYPLITRNGGTLVETSSGVWYKDNRTSGEEDDAIAMIEFLRGLEENDKERFGRMAEVILNIATHEKFAVAGRYVEITPVQRIDEVYFIRGEEAYEKAVRKQICSLEAQLETLKGAKS